MKLYIIIFISILLGSTLTLAYTGIESTSNISNYERETSIKSNLYTAQNRISQLYQSTDDKKLRVKINEISQSIDEVSASYSQNRILQERIYDKHTLRIVIVGLLGLISSMLLWFGTVKYIIRPINSLIEDIKIAPNKNWSMPSLARGPKEIKFLHKTLKEMMHKIEILKKQIKDNERENISRFITHKIKNSLTPIQLCAHNISTLSNDSIVSENSKLILEEIDNTSLFIERFRLFSKLPKPIKSSIDLGSFIKDICKKYNNLILNSFSSAKISADPYLLEESIVNLIQNAVDASIESEAPVTVSLLDTNPPELIISDKGCGMNKEQLSSIFDEYYTSKQRGMGIGMAFVKKVLEVHSFEIDIKSKTNMGTEVRIIFNE